MNSTIQAPVATLLWNAVNHSIFRYFSQDLKLLGGDWNHGILNDFPETVGNGMSWSQLTIRHIFQRGRRKTTNQFGYHGPLIVDIPIKDSDFPVKPPIFDGEINYKLLIFRTRSWSPSDNMDTFSRQVPGTARQGVYRKSGLVQSCGWESVTWIKSI